MSRNPKTKLISKAVEQHIEQERCKKLLKLRGKLSLKDVSGNLEATELKDAEELKWMLRKQT